MSKYVVTGMTCSACQAHVEKAVSHVPGVTKVEVSLLTNSMNVEGSATPEAIIKAVENAGYGAHLDGAEARSSSASAPVSETSRLLRRLINSLIFLFILMYITMGHSMLGWWIPPVLHGNYIGLALIQLILSTIIIYINRAFFISGTKSLMHGSPSMDTLVAMGSGISYIWSIAMLFKMTNLLTGGSEMSELMHVYHNELYFESAAMILALITIGKTLESYSKGRTTDALKELVKLTPKMASVVRDNEVVTIPAGDVVVGDIVAVKPGESFPVDGVIIEGSTSVDESALTGESMPINKGVDDMVSTATVNTTGFVKIRATKVGGDTTFAKIVKMVTDASSSKAPIARIADKVSGVFVPVVVLIAIITFIVWFFKAPVAFALERAITVLVISCPCSLGLATPVAIMVGNGVGARRGILFKNGEALENTGRTKIVALDKTGTITKGHPQVTDVIPASDVTNDELLRMALALECKSEHPLAKAIVEYANARGVKADEAADFEVLPGNGLRGLVGDSTVFAGSYKFISSKTSVDESQLEKLGRQGKTPMLFMVDGKYYGLIAAADVVREDSQEAITKLKDMGISAAMITGDNELTAMSIASQVGIDYTISEVLPDGKAEAVENLMARGRVAMVGDGINDAPALVTANTGIAIGAGTDVAIESADVVLMNSSLMDVVTAIRLSKATLRNIYENLFWAFAYNILLIPMAAGLYPGVSLNPMWGAAAMALSSFCVCMNALRLNLFEINKNKTHKEEIRMEKTIVIEGMMCQMCEKHAREALAAIPGVEVKSVSHVDNNAVVVVSESVTDDALMAAVNGAGYKAIEVK